jgi:outer membrane protein OmpA-like peptidoglycan-associated protein
MKHFLAATLLLCSLSLFAQRLSIDAFQRVNSPFDELNPVISPDGKTLFVTIANHGSNVGGKKDQGDIWVSTLADDNQWSAPVHGGSLLNNAGFNAVAGVSADGNELFLLSHYDGSGQSRTQGISVSKRQGDSWSRPENIVIPYFQNKSNVLNGHILSDQSAFVFSAETYGTRGVEDIYVSLKGSDGKFSEPRNLGNNVNTQFQELSPALSADGKTLYFSSNGRKGSGSFDIYSSVRLDDTWTNWSVPVNLGSGFNTEGRELYYRNYEQRGYAVYSSTKNSDGYGDIRIYLSDEPYRPDSAVVANVPAPDSILIKEVPRPALADKQVRVHGKVTNAKTGEIIAANVFFDASENDQTAGATIADGYSVIIPSTSDYVVKIEAIGYVSTMEKLDIHTYEMNDLEMNFKLQPVEIGTTVNLKDVLFEQGKTNLLTQSYPELNLVVSFLKTNPKVKIELAGHTDNRGIPAQNVKLSQARVDKVKSYLVSMGIDSKRISGKGYGGAKPIASNDSEETRLFNRRVEFIIKKF